MRTAHDALVSLRGVGCGYADGNVLDDIDLDVDDARFTGIVGPSGSGKTTLLRVLLGTLVPRSGTVLRRPGVRIGYVPQLETVDWNFPVTVRECVLMARTTGRRLPWPSAAERHDVHEVLDRLGIGELADRHIRQLSGGQQQRVFLARALLGDPTLLVLDEPTAGVDVATRHEVLHLLDELARTGLSILLTTHDLNGMASHLPHLICMNRAIIASGTPAEVLVPSVLERTYGAKMDVLVHAGLPVVLDHVHAPFRIGRDRPVA